MWFLFLGEPPLIGFEGTPRGRAAHFGFPTIGAGLAIPGGVLGFDRLWPSLPCRFGITGGFFALRWVSRSGP